MRTQLRRSLSVVIAVAAIAAVQNDAADVRRLVEVLELHAGSVVADIGAGDGVLTMPIAREVGPSGRVYATELGGGSLDRLRTAVAKSGLANIEVVEGDPARTNLPPECCDAIFIRNVYHHFADPPAMNTSLLESLKRGGRLAIIDFAPNGAEATSPADRAAGKTHGIGAETVARELQHAGFALVATERRETQGFLLVARKP